MVDLIDAVTRAMTLSATGSPATQTAGGFFGTIINFIRSQKDEQQSQQQSQPQDVIYDQMFPGARRTQKYSPNTQGTSRREVTLDRQMLLGSMSEEQNSTMLLGR